MAEALQSLFTCLARSRSSEIARPSVVPQRHQVTSHPLVVHRWARLTLAALLLVLVDQYACDDWQPNLSMIRIFP